MQVEQLTAAHNPLAISALFYITHKSHLDLGSNEGASLRGLDPSIITCVEKFPNAAAALRKTGTYKDVIEGDVVEVVEKFVEEERNFDIVTAFDFLEHLDREQGENLLLLLEKVYTRALILFVPLETPQLVNSEEYKQRMERVFSTIPLEQRELQDHKSQWSLEDFRNRGFDCYVIKDFHMPGFDALFACKYTAAYEKEQVRENFSKFAGQHTPVYGNFGSNSVVKEPAIIIGHKHIYVGQAVSILERSKIEAVTNYAGVDHYPYLIIGNRVSIELDCHIGAAEYINIGDNTMIAGRVTIMDHNHNYENVLVPPRDQPLVTAGVTIGKNCWIGENVFIGMGVTIGDHCVVGANSVVTKNVPSYTIVAGSPAVPIKRYRNGRWESARGLSLDDYVEYKDAKKHSLSIIIPVYNNYELTTECLRRIKNYTFEDYEVIVVDNGSTDTTKDEAVTIRNAKNEGFATAINQGMQAAKGDIFCIMNNDVFVGSPMWSKGMLDVFDRYDKVGLVGPVSNNGSGIQTVPFPVGLDKFDEFSRDWFLKRDGQVLKTLRLAGFCMMISRELFHTIGSFDTRFLNFEDDDYCVRSALSGFSNYLSIGSYVYHKGQATFNSENIGWQESMEKSKKLFCEKWGSPLSNPYAITKINQDLFI